VWTAHDRVVHQKMAGVHLSAKLGSSGLQFELRGIVQKRSAAAVKLDTLNGGATGLVEGATEAPIATNFSYFYQ
jgi:hypothetical protein